MTGRPPTARRDGSHAMPRHARASAPPLLVTPAAGPARAVDADEPPGPVPPGPPPTRAWWRPTTRRAAPACGSSPKGDTWHASASSGKMGRGPRPRRPPVTRSDGEEMGTMRLRPGHWFEARPPRLLPWAGLLLALAAAPLRADSPRGGGDP